MAIEWLGDRVRIIDQTRLPEEEVYLELGNYLDIASAIKELKIRGAPAIGVAGAYAVAMGALAAWMFLAYVPAFEAVGHNIRTMTYDPATIKSTVSQVGSGICTLGIAFSSLLYLLWVGFRR